MTTVLGVVLAELLPSSSNKTVDTAIGNQQQMQPMPRDHDHNQPDNCVGLNRGPILPNLSGVFLATTVGTDEYHQIRLILSAATSICEWIYDARHPGPAIRTPTRQTYTLRTQCDGSHIEKLARPADAQRSCFSNLGGNQYVRFQILSTAFNHGGYKT